MSTATPKPDLARIAAAAEKSIREEYSEFSGKAYPWVMIVQQKKKGQAALTADADADDKKKTTEDATTQMRVHFGFPVLVNGVCSPPAPTEVSIELTMPSGRSGMISSSGGGGSDDSDDDDDSSKRSKQKKKRATWTEYKSKTQPIIDLVVAALPSSSYLGFSPEQVMASGDIREDHMSICPVKDKKNTFDVMIRGSHTHGYGVYDAEKKEWSDLRHRHKRPGCDDDEEGEHVLFKGPNNLF